MIKKTHREFDVETHEYTYTTLEEATRRVPAYLDGTVDSLIEDLQRMKADFGDNLFLKFEGPWDPDQDIVFYTQRPETEDEKREREAAELQRAEESAKISAEKRAASKPVVEHEWFFDEQGNLLPGQDDGEKAVLALQRINYPKG